MWREVRYSTASELLEAALNLLARGMSQNQVATAFGVSRPTIARLQSAAVNSSEQLRKD